MKILTFAVLGLIMLSINKIERGKVNINDSKYQSYPADAPLIETRWALVELSNKKIPYYGTSTRIFFMLRKDSIVSGNGGCNTFTSRYTVGKNNQIHFGEFVRTNISCQAIGVEQKFINALANADHYYLVKDTLLLNKGASMGLAKFVAER